MLGQTDVQTFCGQITSILAILQELENICALMPLCMLNNHIARVSNVSHVTRNKVCCHLSVASFKKTHQFLTQNNNGNKKGLISHKFSLLPDHTENLPLYMQNESIPYMLLSNLSSQNFCTSLTGLQKRAIITHCYLIR